MLELKEATARSRPGRPRDARLDEALFRSALEVFLERGYSATTFTEVARRAGVGTPALYRRWPNKAAMAIDLFYRELRESPIPPTSSIRQDLIEFLRTRIRQARRPLARQVVLPLLLEGLYDRRVEETIGGRMSEYPKPLLLRIGSAVEARTLRLTIDPTRLLDLLVGTVVLPALFNLPLPDESDAESIVDQVLMGLTPR
jgi:AcrR family transcriptional regulator